MPSGTILVADDEKLIRWSLKESLSEVGYDVEEAETGDGVLRALADRSYDVILLDYKLPDMTGVDVLERIRESGIAQNVIMITAHSSIDNAVRAMQAGATDYVAKPFADGDIALRVGRVLSHSHMRDELQRLRDERRGEFERSAIVGESPAMQQVFRLVERVLTSPSSTLLIQGESGTGKDVLAKAIHYGGSRADGPYMNITCTALPEGLLESELFGHEKGSFTDAKGQKKGLVELADGGTLFLDEIGDMSPYLQAKLLRVLEERRFRRVGGQKDIEVDVRVVAATNRDLKKLAASGEFREDLYFRLNVIPIRLPPLREREGDIPLLVAHFIQHFNREFKKNVRGMKKVLLERFEAYDWPGNVRELRNAIERAMILGTGDELDAQDLPLSLIEESADRPNDTITLTARGVSLEAIERDLVEQALRLTRGNQTRAGKLLGLNRDQIRYRVDKFDLHHLKHPDDK